MCFGKKINKEETEVQDPAGQFGLHTSHHSIVARKKRKKIGKINEIFKDLKRMKRSSPSTRYIYTAQKINNNK
jgi:hypothetical protein